MNKINKFFTKRNLKIFISTLIAILIIVSLQLNGIKPPSLAIPLSSKKDIFIEKIAPKLEKKRDTYNLKIKQQVISQVNAEKGNDYKKAKAYGVINFDTGEIIDSNNLKQELPIASLTKIMTAIVSLDLADPNEDFRVSRHAAFTVPTKIGVVAGEKLKVSELMHAILMTSANDAVEVLKEGIDNKYGQDVFINAMNEKAKFLGLKNTSFTNAQGFDNINNYSSVEDLAKLTHYALSNYPLISDIVAKDYLYLPADQYHKQFDLYNWNGLLDVYPDTIGMKIGNTDNAGYTMIAVSKREGTCLITVVLGAPGILERDLWTADLLDEGYKSSLGLSPVNITENQLLTKYNTWNYWN